MYYLAVDIGASSGRHMLGHWEDGQLILEEIYRFSNGAAMKNGHLCWDVDRLFEEILNGLAACQTAKKLPKTMGIDTWGVDFVLLDRCGRRMGDAVSYRDDRTAGMDAVVREKISDAELYARTGIQKQRFNTIYQLASLGSELERADSLMLLPDYFNYLLTGVRRFEYTNASTTGLLHAGRKAWDDQLLALLGYPKRLFPALDMPGGTIGCFTPEIAARVGFSCTVVLPATHDTASAFLAVPADSGIVLSSGTWSLLGVELPAPITGPESRQANFTNEGGYDGRYRYLKNIMGLWMIQSIQKELPQGASFPALGRLAQAARYEGVIDVNHEDFLAPRSMTQAVRAHCIRRGLPAPETPGQLLRCVYRSLAVCYRDAIRQLEGLTGQTYTAIHVVGGGSQAEYLNRLTAQYTGLPVYAGPTEATALGNLMAQLLCTGEFTSLRQARDAAGRSVPIRAYR